TDAVDGETLAARERLFVGGAKAHARAAAETLERFDDAVVVDDSGEHQLAYAVIMRSLPTNSARSKRKRCASVNRATLPAKIDGASAPPTTSGATNTTIFCHSPRRMKSECSSEPPSTMTERTPRA